MRMKSKTESKVSIDTLWLRLRASEEAKKKEDAGSTFQQKFFFPKEKKIVSFIRKDFKTGSLQSWDMRASAGLRDFKGLNKKWNGK